MKATKRQITSLVRGILKEQSAPLKRVLSIRLTSPGSYWLDDQQVAAPQSEDGWDAIWDNEDGTIDPWVLADWAKSIGATHIKDDNISEREYSSDEPPILAVDEWVDSYGIW